MHTINNNLFRDSCSISLSLWRVSPDLLRLTPPIPLSAIEAPPGVGADKNTGPSPTPLIVKGCSIYSGGESCSLCIAGL